MTNEEDAWAQGYEVGFDEDGSRTDNPYPEGTTTHSAWLDGYDHGCADFFDQLETEEE